MPLIDRPEFRAWLEIHDDRRVGRRHDAPTGCLTCGNELHPDVSTQDELEGWWAESPDLDGWSAAGSTYAEVRHLARDGVPFALGRDTTLEHYAPVGERLPA
jgi:hypothetical protein